MQRYIFEGSHWLSSGSYAGASRLSQAEPTLLGFKTGAKKGLSNVIDFNTHLAGEGLWIEGKLSNPGKATVQIESSDMAAITPIEGECRRDLAEEDLNYEEIAELSTKN